MSEGKVSIDLPMPCAHCDEVMHPYEALALHDGDIMHAHCAAETMDEECFDDLFG